MDAMTHSRSIIIEVSLQLQLLLLPVAIRVLLLSQCWCLSFSFVTAPYLSSMRSSKSLAYYYRQHQYYGVGVRHHSLQPTRIHHLNGPIRRDLTMLYNSQHGDNVESASPTSPYPSLRVGIVGAGSVAFGTASLAATLGHDPMIWSPSGAGTRELLDERSDDNMFTTKSIQSTGALAHDFNVRVARYPRDLVHSNDNVLVLALPANGHRKVMEELASEIIEFIMEKRQLQQANDVQVPEMMHIIISAHASLGAVYFMQLLQEERRRYSLRRSDKYGKEYSNVQGIGNEDDFGVRITAWGTTAVTARKTSGTSVNVLTVRQSVDFCTVPSTPESTHESEDGMLQSTMSSSVWSRQKCLANGKNICTSLFGQRFKHRKGGLLAISLSNLNAQNHLGIVLGNMSRMDQPPPPPPPDGFSSSATPDTSIEPWYQAKNITPNIGRLMEALDRERLDIAKALDIDVRTIYEHFSWSFHVPMETPAMEITNESEELNPGQSPLLTKTMKKMRPLSVSEMNQQMHHYLRNDVSGPSSPDSRYVLEDVPYGLVLIVILGRLVKCPATLHESGIKIISAMYGRDFTVENDLLQGLGLIEEGDIPSLDKWREMAFLGHF
mmetsp:Transcript_8316/g.17965  ORF Transcript_8316/g.17965 Transcript_8316/m.17965 type:complete len:608 (-) Transcript_8316:134-1957(-)